MAIYLDYAATTPPDGRVVEAMCGCMRMVNPSAAYSAAGEARRELRLARQAVARMLGVDHAGVYFTSGGSEANAWAMAAARHAAVSAAEHMSVLNAAPNAVRIPATSDGVITPENVEKSLRPDTQLVSVQWANNETGVIHPIDEISRVVRKHGALLHVDAVQAFGHVPVDAKLCDMMSLSAHKLYGPRGAGCLYVRPGVTLRPLIPGGGQETGMRGGTENTPAICGFRVATELAEADMAERERRERGLLEAFVEQLGIPGMRVLGQNARRLPGVIALYIPRLSAEEAILKLDLQGIQLSGGAACHSRAAAPSHVYTAMGLTQQQARQVLRISIGRGTTAEELSQAAQAIRALIPAK